MLLASWRPSSARSKYVLRSIGPSTPVPSTEQHNTAEQVRSQVQGRQPGIARPTAKILVGGAAQGPHAFAEKAINEHVEVATGNGADALTGGPFAAARRTRTTGIVQRHGARRIGAGCHARPRSFNR